MIERVWKCENESHGSVHGVCGFAAAVLKYLHIPVFTRHTSRSAATPLFIMCWISNEGCLVDDDRNASEEGAPRIEGAPDSLLLQLNVFNALWNRYFPAGLGQEKAPGPFLAKKPAVSPSHQYPPYNP